jgi:glucose-6-phosphate 1-epimerase
MPSTISITRFQDQDAIELLAPDGARAVVTLHGAHVLSWTPAGGEEQFYLSPKSAYGAGEAIRGGVPVVFPQFGGRGPLQKHGFARTKPWQLVSAEQGEDDALAVFRLNDDEASRMVWPHRFALELSVRVSGQDLDLELACENLGEDSFTFTTALHTYLRVADIAAASVQGLSGKHYWDSANGGDEKLQRVDLLLPDGEIDRIYQQITQDLTLIEQRGAGERRVQVSQQGFEDAVVWNPGAQKCAAIADMPADDYKQMLCIEAATVGHPVELSAGETWVGRQHFTLASAGR